MNLYISDTHFGHANCIRHDNRPFENVEEMDRIMIELWNKRVHKDDNVYIIGYLIFRSDKDETWYLEKLKGKKHLIKGNHDDKLLKNEKAMSYFESVDRIAGVQDNLDGENIQIVLCHYPMVEWYKSRHGSWHIYGHIHGRENETSDIMSKIPRALNAGAMVNNYTPASIKELIRNNEIYYGNSNFVC